MKSKYLQKLHKLIISKHPGTQNYVSIINSFLTLLALIITVCFSLAALRRTDIQNANALQQLTQAQEQLKLAQQQFKLSKQTHDEDIATANQRSKIEDDRFNRDTLKQRLRDHNEEIRNKAQEDINRSQLTASQIQAKALESQFKQQQTVYQQQLYDQRPIFNLDSLHVDKVNDVRSFFQFTFSNIGGRTAHVDSTMLAFFNDHEACFSVTKNSANLDLVPFKNNLNTSAINSYAVCISSKETVFYLVIYFKDKVTGSNNIEPIFFQYQYTPQHQFRWSRASRPMINDFIVRLKRKGAYVED